MQYKILEWLRSDHKQTIVLNGEKNRLTIYPKDGYVQIKYWEPSPIKGTEISIWKSLSKIKISTEFIDDFKDYETLSEILFQKLEKGGNYEITSCTKL